MFIKLFYKINFEYLLLVTKAQDNYFLIAKVRHNRLETRKSENVQNQNLLKSIFVFVLLIIVNS